MSNATFRPRTLKLTLLVLILVALITSLTLLVITLNPVSQLVSLHSDMLSQRQSALLTSSDSQSFSSHPSHVVVRYSALSAPEPYANATLGIAGRIYVISLPRRGDRHVRMEALGKFMGLDFTFVNATDASANTVTTIMERVRWERVLHAIHIHWGFSPEPSSNLTDLERSDYIEWLPDAHPYCDFENENGLLQSDHLGLDGSDLWTLDPLQDKRSSQFTNPLSDPPSPDLRLPLPCAPIPLSLPSLAQSHEDAVEHDKYGTTALGKEAVDDAPQIVPTPHSPFAFHLTLSRGMIACWHSHVQVLRRISEGNDNVALVLEDDVDVEYDLKARLALLWSSLPAQWDIVFLGHCWSPSEGMHSALRTITVLDYPDNTSHKSYTFALHPSVSPKCTHAYVVSKSGANRIIRHLRTTANRSSYSDLSEAYLNGNATQDETPSCRDSRCSGTPFAYCRALDQALVRLIQGGRLQAFSIVPSLVVQTKDSPSDIMHGNGSRWKDELVDSALGRMYPDTPT